MRTLSNRRGRGSGSDIVRRRSLLAGFAHLRLQLLEPVKPHHDLPAQLRAGAWLDYQEAPAVRSDVRTRYSLGVGGAFTSTSQDVRAMLSSTAQIGGHS